MADAVEQFKGIPMGDLIGGPLAASCAAQYNLAYAMVQFIQQIGFKDNKTQTIDFDLERPVDDGSGTIKSETVSVKAPLLGLVPIPALLIDLVTVDFSMEVKQTTSSKTSTTAEIDMTAKVNYGLFFSASVQGKISTNRENTRSTDNTAKYNVHVQARQQPAAEGLSKLMDLLSSATEPIKATAASG